jgi:hypothetical protein
MRRNYVFVLKKRGNDIIKLYGSVKALMDSEKIEINGHPVGYNRMMYLLGKDHYYTDKKQTIKRCDVISSKNKL